MQIEKIQEIAYQIGGAQSEQELRDDGQMSFNQNPDDIGNGLEMQSMNYNNDQD